jgi:acyl carrier protein
MATSEEVVAFTIESLEDMNILVDGVDEETTIGPLGVDLDSIAVSELAFRIEDRYGVSFFEDEVERLGGMTLGEFGEIVAERAMQEQFEGAVL